MILLGHGKTGASVDCRSETKAVDWFHMLIRRGDAMDGVHVKGDIEVCTREYLYYFFEFSRTLHSRLCFFVLKVHMSI